jgi:hypothetical protein
MIELLLPCGFDTLKYCRLFYGQETPTTCHLVFRAWETIESEGIVTKIGTYPLSPNPNKNQ